ncbi:MAG: MgtC/SapB family protein [Muribaculaceae bacterium]|nr:MgtC/SapB family protein [Muribaculaceae bacterium]
MQQLYNDIISPDVTITGAIFKLLLSLVLGSLIGFERNRKGQVAGLRTFGLICTGATLAMLISIYIPQEYFGLKNGDPGRIAAQVISGIGFLGAGAIIQMKGSVRGLTTAAGIWMTACIGLAVGAGMYIIAIVTTVIIIFILVNIERFEQRANFLRTSKVIRVKIRGIVNTLEPAKDIFRNHDIKANREYMQYDYDNQLTTINFIVLTKRDMNLPAIFNDFHDNFDVISITLTNETNI